MVLSAAKKACVQLVALDTPGKTFNQLVVESSADGCGKGCVGVRNAVSSVGDVGRANQGVRKGRKFSNRDIHARPEQNRVPLRIE